MNEAEKRSNLLGLIILFFVFTVLGIILSFFYVIFQTSVHDMWLNVIAAFVMGGALALVAWLVKWFLKITNNFMSVVVVLLGLAIILYVMWSMWFVLMFDFFVLFSDEVRGIRDIGAILSETREMIFSNPEFIQFLRLFNESGTWHINDNIWTGPILWIVWAGETLIIAVIPILAAYASAGLFINELNSWVGQRLMNYGFSAFDDYELDRIASGDIDAIIEKPLETRNGPMSAVAVCYLKDEPTEFIAIYNASWDKDGALSKGRHIMTVQIGADKIDALDVGLQAKHYPDIPQEEPIHEQESYDSTEIEATELETTESESTATEAETSNETGAEPETDLENDAPASNESSTEDIPTEDADPSPESDNENS